MNPQATAMHMKNSHRVLALFATLLFSGLVNAQQTGAVTRGQASPGTSGPACSIQLLQVDATCDAPESGTCAVLQATNRQPRDTNVCVSVKGEAGSLRCETLRAGASRQLSIFLGELSAAQVGRIDADCMTDAQMQAQAEPT